MNNIGNDGMDINSKNYYKMKNFYLILFICIVYFVSCKNKSNEQPINNKSSVSTVDTFVNIQIDALGNLLLNEKQYTINNFEEPLTDKLLSIKKNNGKIAKVNLVFDKSLPSPIKEVAQSVVDRAINKATINVNANNVVVK